MILLLGTGRMALEYAKVLKALNQPFLAVGRGEESARQFTEATGIAVVTGGLASFISGGGSLPSSAIVAVNVTSLYDSCSQLLTGGVRRILLEKPGALTVNEITDLARMAVQKGASVYIAYNRRFHASVTEARKILEADGGVTSLRFEFTEWSDRIAPFEADREEKENWFLSNSSHVADLAFFLGGIPEAMECFTGGSLGWHPNSSSFCGAGRTSKDILFSYSANWDAPGRWGVEAMSRNFRIILQPLEQLLIQKRGSVAVEKVEIDDSADREFKPGLLRMVGDFTGGVEGTLCTLSEQAEVFRSYCRMAGYKLA